MKKLIIFIITIISVLFLVSCNDYLIHKEYCYCYDFEPIYQYQGATYVEYSVKIVYDELDDSKLPLQYVEPDCVTFPTEYNGRPVTKIKGVSAFFDKKNIVIPDGIKTIGAHAFSFSTIKTVSISKTVEVIEDKAFYCCGPLENIDIPEGVKEIGDNAFFGTDIHDFKIPSTVISLHPNSFGDELESISVDESNPIYDSRENCNAVILTEDNYLMITSKSTTLPSSVKKIYINRYFNWKLIGRFYADSLILANDILDNITLCGEYYTFTMPKKVRIEPGFKNLDYFLKVAINYSSNHSDICHIYYEGLKKELRKDIKDYSKGISQEIEVLCLDGHIVI